MSKIIIMTLYNKLRATNSKLAKTKIGRSLLMQESVNTVFELKRNSLIIRILIHQLNY